MNTTCMIYNPSCSKCREALTLLKNEGVEPTVIDYLNGELTRELLETILATLKVHPKEILRTKEEEFQRLNLDVEDREKVIEAILTHPKILERPIVIKDNKAVIGRPAVKVLELLK